MFPSFEKIQSFYAKGLWDKEKVKAAVKYQCITPDEYEKITGEAYLE
ncbi:XkdX family protein [Listeria innocua]|nr:XkdX family protein [Listeria innocua]EAF5011230.1 XkdX family protein [Listeria innocua]EDO1200591.1 XkdX family protein [Listeria innocua]EHF3591736.1 XkdX family protein [Listeria innocua]EHF3606810.1 XkdX family protein [Listeria innocua]